MFEQACGVPHSDEEDIHHSQPEHTSGQEFDRRQGCSCLVLCKAHHLLVVFL